MEFTEDQVKIILEKYKKSLQDNRDRYHNVRKINPEFMEKNRQRSREHYKNNTQKKVDYYNNHKIEINIKQRFRYYKKKNDIEKFKEKFPDDYKMLIDTGYIKL